MRRAGIFRMAALPLTWLGMLGTILNPSGRRQVVRRQPSKLIFVGSSPIARSFVFVQ